MSTRVITATITGYDSTDLANGGYAVFTIDSDAGAVERGQPTAATLSVDKVKCYAASAYLQVKYDDSTGTALATTGALSGDSTTHAEDFNLSGLDAGLVTASPSKVYLCVVATSGSSSKINFREGCSIVLAIEYTVPPTACGEPSNVMLDVSTSPGYAVPIRWKAGSSGTNNALAYYEIARMESEDGFTGNGDLEIIATTSALTYNVFPPTITGRYYLFFVRAVGTAGTGYASAWVACENALYKARPTLLPYTDPVLIPGETLVKAAHISQIQANVNMLRQGMGMTVYSFTTVTAGQTELAGWSAHVAELRAAIDETGVEHDAWIDIPVNSPTAAVMMQLREVVASI